MGVIEEIVKQEWDFFSRPAMRAEGRPAKMTGRPLRSCAQASLMPWPEELLESYLKDLKAGGRSGMEYGGGEICPDDGVHFS